MVFSSITFLFAFLPAALLLYFVSPMRWRNVILLVLSLIFYAWGEPVYVLLMLLSIVLNYLFALGIEAGRARGEARRILILAVVVNLGLLAVFKYGGFVVDNVLFLFHCAWPRLGGSSRWLRLPIGISFFTFHALSYVIDVYRGVAKAQRNPLTMGLYIALFPPLIAGPIVRYHQVARQLVKRRVTWEGFDAGVGRFIIGLGKKVLIANTLSAPADRIFALPAGEAGTALAWLGVLCYMGQIYFDFSGYSDMAIGLGRMFGFHFLENFDHPYISRSIREFWRRWHISLSTWFRDYLYIPLGGNRCPPFRVYLNLLLVFFLCGLWHGAAWTFVVWGMFHGFFMMLERTPAGAWIERRPRVLQHVYALLAVIVGWTLFRAHSLTQAGAFLKAMAGGGSVVRPDLFVEGYLTVPVIVALAVALVASLPVLPWLRARLREIRLRGAVSFPLEFSGAVGWRAALAMVFFLSVTSLALGTHNPFIYFRF